MSTPPYDSGFLQRSSQRPSDMCGVQNGFGVGAATTPFVDNRRPGIFPPEIWDMIIASGLVFPGVLSPAEMAGGSWRLIHNRGRLWEANQPNHELLARLSLLSSEIRSSALRTFFSRNNFVFEAGSGGGRHRAWSWFDLGYAQAGAEYLRNVTVSLDLRPGTNGGRLSSVVSLLRLIGRSRYLDRLTLNIDNTALSGDFRQHRIFRVLAEFRNVRHLTITFNTAVPGAEQWLRERMTTSNIRGEAGRRHMPAVWGSTLPSLSRVNTWSAYDYETWALVLDVDRRNRSRAEIRRLVRAFVDDEKIARTQLDSPTTSGSSQQAQVIQNGSTYPARIIASPSHDTAVIWMQNHQIHRPHSLFGDGSSMATPSISRTFTSSVNGRKRDLQETDKTDPKTKKAKLDNSDEETATDHEEEG